MGREGEGAMGSVGGRGKERERWRMNDSIAKGMGII